MFDRRSHTATPLISWRQVAHLASVGQHERGAPPIADKANHLAHLAPPWMAGSLSAQDAVLPVRRCARTSGEKTNLRTVSHPEVKDLYPRLSLCPAVMTLKVHNVTYS